MLTSILLLLLSGAIDGPISDAADVRFRRHTLNSQSEYPACAALDVNGDGRLDVVSGGWWYEAPQWTRHRVRDVEMIRGRYDDYSNLPLDVNGDGWTDLVSANYRSQSIYWVEHPGSVDRDWKKHVVDTPGAMETARLYDIDGDGQLDVLPNGLQMAAWWELAEQTAEGEDPTADRRQWIRHDLPSDVAGHGIGFGDIDGDGRGDIVGPRGWLEAPTAARGGRWLWHPEFELHRDASIPILVLDVDGDEDSDLVWGRGHDIGVYWLEQDGSSGQRQWHLHAIDTSCSEMHSLLLADINADGAADVVAGKRYMGHDGKDPGEYDPLVIYWYEFDRQRRVWHRHLVSEGGGAGFGLDPKAVDLDGDGDVDLIGPGRSGLYWFENLLVSRDRQPPPASAPPEATVHQDHTQLLIYQTPDGQLQRVDTHAEWALRKAQVLAAMQQVMGTQPPPSRRVPLAVEVLSEERTDHYVRRKITFAAEPGDRVPAFVLIPHELKSRAPAMLCLHQTIDIGKQSPVGLGGRPTLHYAHELALRGYVCLAPDYPSFGEYDYQFDGADEAYTSGSMKAIWNNIRALDVLESMPEVNRDRIGCIGHSLGAHNALFTACFDQRIRAIISSCGFTAFHHYYGGNLSGWTSDRYMPLIEERYHSDPDQVPFDFYEVIACLAPRPVFSNAPLEDSNFDVAGVRKVVGEAQKVYELTGAPQQLHVVYPEGEHEFFDAVREQAYSWLDQQLK